MRQADLLRWVQKIASELRGPFVVLFEDSEGNHFTRSGMITDNAVDEQTLIVEQRQNGKARKCRPDILTVLRAAGGRMTKDAIVTALEILHHPTDARTVERELAALLEDGIIDNPADAKPRGYALLSENATNPSE